MPYSSIVDLPESVRHVLPEHAQKIYLAAFNRAWSSFSDELKENRETSCHKIAWSAVKKGYEKKAGNWVKKDN